MYIYMSAKRLQCTNVNNTILQPSPHSLPLPFTHTHTKHHHPYQKFTVETAIRFPHYIGHVCVDSSASGDRSQKARPRSPNYVNGKRWILLINSIGICSQEIYSRMHIVRRWMNRVLLYKMIPSGLCYQISQCAQRYRGDHSKWLFGMSGAVILLPLAFTTRIKR